MNMFSILFTTIEECATDDVSMRNEHEIGEKMKEFQLENMKMEISCETEEV